MDYKIDTNWKQFFIVYFAIIAIWIVVRLITGQMASFKETLNSIAEASIDGFIWGATYLFIRRKFNPDVMDMYVHSDDAIFGGMAAFAATLIRPIARETVKF